MKKYLKGIFLNGMTFLKLVQTLSHYKKGNYKNPDALIAYQNKQLRKVIRAALNHKIYREKFEAVGILEKDIVTVDDLQKIPALTKDELRAWMNTEVEKVDLDWCMINRTSGSSGVPMQMLYSIREKAMANAAWIRILAANGYNPFLDKTMAIKVHAKDKPDSFIQKLGLLRRYTYSALSETEFLVDKINEVQPGLLYTNKSTLVKIALYVRDKKIDIFKPKLICSTAEKLDETSRQLIVSCFGDVLFQSYGAEEVSAFTYTKCEEPYRHYITMDTHAILVRDAQGKSVKNGTGEIFVTALFKKDFPIINYALRDEVEVFEEENILYIRKINGRNANWFLAEDGEIIGYHAFYHVSEECPYVYQLRYIQDDYHSVRIQAVRNEREAALEDVEKYITDSLQSMLEKYEFTFRFEWMDAIPLDSNGKTKLMICNIPGIEEIKPH